MTIGSGLAGFIGVAAESTYGTYVAATRYPEVRSAKIVRKPHYVQGTGLAAGRLVDPAQRHVNTWWSGDGPIELEWLNTNMGLLLNAIMGSTASPIQIGATTAYTLTAPLGSTDGHSLSIQEVVPDTAGALHPYSAQGVKIVDAEFTFERGGIAMCQLTCDAQDVNEVPTVDTPTFTAGAQCFHGDQSIIKVGPLGSEVQIDGVKKFQLKIARKLATERIYLGNALKSEPVTDGVIEITGTFEVDLVGSAVKAAFADMFASHTFFSLIHDTVGNQIGSSGHNDELKFSTPSMVLTGTTPDLSGPAVVTGSFPFKVDLDAGGDDPLTAVWTSADTAL